MASLEYDVNGYVLFLEGDEEVDPTEPIFDTLVDGIVAWDRTIDLTEFSVTRQELPSGNPDPNAWDILFVTQDGREGRQTLEFQGDRALLTWDIPDSIEREEIRPYPAVRQTIINLIQRKGVHTVEVTYNDN